jgi:hypothetical protein
MTMMVPRACSREMPMRHVPLSIYKLCFCCIEAASKDVFFHQDDGGVRCFLGKGPWIFDRWGEEVREFSCLTIYLTEHGQRD